MQKPAIVIVICSACWFAVCCFADTEADYNCSFCASVGGQQETRHEYTYGAGKTGYVVIDCETDTQVWEGGLDKRSSLDSVQQAIFASHLTGKVPGIVIYDTDGEEGQYEFRIRIAAELADVEFVIYDWEEGLPEEEAEAEIPDLSVLPDFGSGFDFGW